MPTHRHITKNKIFSKYAALGIKRSKTPSCSQGLGQLTTDWVVYTAKKYCLTFVEARQFKVVMLAGGFF